MNIYLRNLKIYQIVLVIFIICCVPEIEQTSNNKLDQLTDKISSIDILSITKQQLDEIINDNYDYDGIKEEILNDKPINSFFLDKILQVSKISQDNDKSRKAIFQKLKQIIYSIEENNQKKSNNNQLKIVKKFKDKPKYNLNSKENKDNFSKTNSHSELFQLLCQKANTILKINLNPDLDLPKIDFENKKILNHQKYNLLFTNFIEDICKYGFSIFLNSYPVIELFAQKYLKRHNDNSSFTISYEIEDGKISSSFSTSKIDKILQKLDKIYVELKNLYCKNNTTTTSNTQKYFSDIQVYLKKYDEYFEKFEKQKIKEKDTIKNIKKDEFEKFLKYLYKSLHGDDSQLEKFFNKLPKTLNYDILKTKYKIKQCLYTARQIELIIQSINIELKSANKIIKSLKDITEEDFKMKCQLYARNISMSFMFLNNFLTQVKNLDIHTQELKIAPKNNKKSKKKNKAKLNKLHKIDFENFIGKKIGIFFKKTFENNIENIYDNTIKYLDFSFQIYKLYQDLSYKLFHYKNNISDDITFYSSKTYKNEIYSYMKYNTIGFKLNQKWFFTNISRPDDSKYQMLQLSFFLNFYNMKEKDFKKLSNLCFVLQYRKIKDSFLIPNEYIINYRIPYNPDNNENTIVCNEKSITIHLQKGLNIIRYIISPKEPQKYLISEFEEKSKRRSNFWNESYDTYYIHKNIPLLTNPLVSDNKDLEMLVNMLNTLFDIANFNIATLLNKNIMGSNYKNEKEIDIFKYIQNKSQKFLLTDKNNELNTPSTIDNSSQCQTTLIRETEREKKIKDYHQVLKKNKTNYEKSKKYMSNKIFEKLKKIVENWTEIYSNTTDKKDKKKSKISTSTDLENEKEELENQIKSLKVALKDNKNIYEELTDIMNITKGRIKNIEQLSTLLKQQNVKHKVIKKSKRSSYYNVWLENHNFMFKFEMQHGKKNKKTEGILFKEFMGYHLKHFDNLIFNIKTEIKKLSKEYKMIS